MMKNIKYLLVTGILLAMTGSAYSVSDILKEGKNEELQKAKELELSEKTLDEQILEINTLLSRYYKLIDIDITHTPMKTTFRKCRNGVSSPKKGDENCQNEDYIELEVYNFIPESYSSNRTIGYKSKMVRLYFKDKTLVKVMSRVIEENFKMKVRYDSIVVDNTPTTDDTSDIKIQTRFNTDDPYQTLLGNMENTLSSPTRINFKRDFYVKHLTYFERMFRYVEEYAKRYGSNKDLVTVERLKRALEY